jgi:pantetheine-phosphate adenylyltransferase
MTTGLYAGSFDPITNGHIDIIKRSMQFCQQLVLAVGVNTKKQTMFSDQERLVMMNQVIEKELDFLAGTNVQAIAFSGLMINLAREVGANVLVRGIRSVSDFEYEINLANVNKVLAPEIETVFLPTSPELAVVSSSAVKEIARFEGNISKFVPSYIGEAIKKKFGFVKFGDPEK